MTCRLCGTGPLAPGRRTYALCDGCRNALGRRGLLDRYRTPPVRTSAELVAEAERLGMADPRRLQASIARELGVTASALRMARLRVRDRALAGV